MKVLLLSIGLALVCAIQAAADVSGKPIQTEKLKGQWHTISMATNEMKLIEKDGTMRFFFKTVTPRNTDELIVTMLKEENNKCTEYNLVIKQTEEPNKFRPVPFTDNKRNLIIMADTDYLNYALVVIQHYDKELDREVTVVQCLSRTLEVTPEVVEKFNKLLKDYNISEKNVINMNNEKDICRL
ncbi:beta-lactoglobulin-1A/1C-like [Tachyglossus aculeatus]|uniref:beta-lactoglobulin-1A/1C-like n=1 Tax=Tachyglossus aculeatus TaxID=9261 RepID=UPI0018F7B187|nr:beta-lactoglobulin-1A/1C-like [Tachyglossus aculeatus]